MFDFPHPVRGTILVNVIIILTLITLEIALNKFTVEPENKAEKKAEMKAEIKAEMKADKKAEEKKLFSKHEVLYDNLALLNPDKKDDLLKDISKRTGIKINKVKIKRIDLIKDNAVLDVYYKEKSGKAEM